MAYDIEITHDRKFLHFFMDKRNMFKLSPESIERLRDSEDPYGCYGYGRWLGAVQPDGNESLKEAKKRLEYAAENGVADAKAVMSIMAFYGDLYNEKKEGIWERNDALCLILNAQAQEEGSELAKLQNCLDLFWGNLIPADKELAMERCLAGEAEPGSSPMWTEQSGWFHELEGNYEEAIRKYEECIERGLYEPLYDMALIYWERGNKALYESLMEEGIEKEVAACMTYGFEYEEDWDKLSPEQQEEIHQRLKRNLYRGVELGNGHCAYTLSFYLMNGLMGFRRDMSEGVRIVDLGIKYHSMYSCEVAMDNLYLVLDSKEYLTIQLKALRYGYTEKLEDVMNYEEAYERIGYGDEIRNIWKPKWEQMLKEMESAGEPASEPIEPLPVLTRTEINPTVLVIDPSGYVDFVEADVNKMSYREMAALIDAESLDAVHFSDALTKITKSCRLQKNVAMYVDRDGIAKDLPDNAVGTILYGRGYEIRGAVIIALEDNRYDTWSFEFEEDIEGVYDQIDDITGLLRRDLGQEDGRYDAWA